MVIDLYEDEEFQIWKDEDDFVSLNLITHSICISMKPDAISRLTNALIKVRKDKGL